MSRTDRAGRRGHGDLARTVRLFRRFRGDKKVYVAGVVLLVFEAATAVVEPYPIAYLVDFLQGARPSLRELGAPQVLTSERFETILLLTLAIIGIAAINSAADSLTEVCMARGGRSLGYSIRVAMYSHLQRLPLGYHDRKRTGDVLTRVTGDVLVVEDFVVKSVSNILGSLLVLVGSFAFLATQSLNVALVALVVVPILALVSRHFSRRIKVASKTQRDREGDLASTAQEMLTSIRLVQSYGRGTVDLERFSDQTSRSMRASLSAANIQAQFSFVIALVEALAISAVVWLGVWLVDRRAITIGTLVLFVLLLQNMFKPARKIVSEWYKIGKVFASVERIDDLLDREVTVSDLPDAVEAPSLTGRLRFEHVRFAYPVEHPEPGVIGRPVLEDVDFEVRPGEVVALIGPSGAGKSTVAQLVPRLYDPDDGQVLVDGLPLQSLTLASLRRQVTVVLQDTILLTGTVAENIGYGIADATRDQVEAAARMANAHDFITELPQGYETMLGERGATLSGGQRQRIAIARAFIRRAPILILDEPTNGLDQESADVVVRALLDLMKDTTTILISHDQQLVRCADRTLVVADGQVLEGAAARRRVARRAVLPGRRDVTDLAAPLRAGLPGVDKVLDLEAMATEIEDRMLSPGTGVRSLAVAKLWLREDRTCSLRYRVGLSDGDEPDGEGLLLGRLHHDDGRAARYLADRVAPLVRPARELLRSERWSTSTSLVGGTGLALHRFPCDPDLPTLPAALEPDVVARLLGTWGTSEEPRVTVVHHPRRGAAVLRYETVHPLLGAAVTRYAKVYPDERAAEAARDLLRRVASAANRSGETTVGFPVRVTYHPELRLLVTDGLPGRPAVPGLVRAALGDPDGAAAGDLREAVATAGRALAALHALPATHAPVRTPGDELDRLRPELELVRELWPVAAEAAEQALADLASAPAGGTVPTGPVLSHGDFTPSQVLLGDGTVSLVDLDTLCLADPTLDLGRFLAHLELLVAKVGGPAALDLADELAAELLRGYRERSGRDPLADGTQLLQLHKTTSLARSALHACRQLKGERLDLALTLLHDNRAERIPS